MGTGMAYWMEESRFIEWPWHWSVNQSSDNREGEGLARLPLSICRLFCTFGAVFG